MKSLSDFSVTTFSRAIPRAALALVALAVASQSASAAAGDLRWQPSPSPGVVGYRLYVGFDSGFFGAGQISATVDIGSNYTLLEGVASHTLDDLISGPSWLVLTAYDATGRESGPSNQRFRDPSEACFADSTCADAEPSTDADGEPSPEGGSCDGDACEGGGTLPGSELPVSPSDPSDPGAEPGAGAYLMSFDSLDVGQDPESWLDTGARNSLLEADLFEIIELSGGNKVFGTRSNATNIHSHWVMPDSGSWHGYELSGRMQISASGGGIGVTLYSDYPNSDSYYRLRRYGSGSFHFSPHSDGGSTCVGERDTGVRPQAGTWYSFRVRALDETSGTRLQAKVWETQADEPSGWQADCLDASSGRRTGGGPGLWAMGSGEKYWDDLALVAVQHDAYLPFLPEPECASDDSCSDGDVCNGIERCVAGSCRDATPLVCGDPGLCAVSSCDALAGCTVQPEVDGSWCGSGDACTAADRCRDGVCLAGASLSCPEPAECYVGRCDVVTGCEAEPMPDGSACDDASESTLNDVCRAGVCQGTLPPPEAEAPTSEAPPIGESGRLFFDFEDSVAGEDPPGWLDTGGRNSLRESDHFEVFHGVAGSRVFGTRSGHRNIHSHYVAHDSHGWYDYELRGRMLIDRKNAGIGVTVYSDFPASDSYYRLRRFGNNAFHLASHPDDEGMCEGTTSTSEIPRAGVWYQFRFQAFDDQWDTRIRAKVWNAEEAEPDGWEINCLAAAGEAYFSGSPGLWSMGKGGKYWDDLEVIEIELTEPEATEPEPSKAEVTEG